MLTAVTLENMHAFLTHAVSSPWSIPFQTEMPDISNQTDNKIAVFHNVPIQLLSIQFFL